MKQWLNFVPAPATGAIAGAALFCAMALPAAAQPHQVAEGGYILRSSTVDSRTLAAATAKSHGIVPQAGLGVLNVSVYRSTRAAYDPLPADVHARVTGIAGVERDVEMRPARVSGDVSYVGTYHYGPNDTLTFSIEARPEGSDRALSLTYQDKPRGY
jgi:hypothetical protein